ncbi:polyadenylate-binding protein-interacting protein 1 [Betta splendens]|uniref:Polyadenylate-binding protein-interacting protein 1 n=1 Tax=Betta splendens TaxID=158456 RepID=A0A6P7NBW5_BETSP|nr:polyadenylate-binding protein-interacting protein 1 [Betta splendens]
MNENFDRAPGAGRTRNVTAEPGVAGISAGDDSNGMLFSQREPLRQPRTSPPYAENNAATDAAGGDYKRQNRPQQSAEANSTSAYRVSNGGEAVAKSSSLSASAPEFVPTGFSLYEDPQYEDAAYYYGEETLADTVKDFLGYLSSSPGSFETDIENITGMLNSWVTTEDLLEELVDLIFTQSTAIPNFSYTGARLCNYLSHHLTPPSGNFRQMLLKRCHTEFEKKDSAVKGDPETQKKFHSFVLFLGELYLNLEVKSGKGPPARADILLRGLCDLMKSLFSNPEDANLICAVKLLKLTGSVLDDTWKEKGQSHMEDLMKNIDTILLDATGSRYARQMLLNLLKLRSSDWGRVHAAAAASNATPDTDPNYFMNEPTFYTEDGTPFTAADPEYAEKYQEILDKEDYFHDIDGDDLLDFDEDEMEPEIEEAFEKFCFESERKRQQ